MKNQFDEKSLKDSGLFYLDERKNEYVDRFRGRLIFPIYSLTGKPIAIGGRIIEIIKKLQNILILLKQISLKKEIIFII